MASPICVSLGDLSWREFPRALARYQMAEIRLDLLRLDPGQVADIFSSHPNLVATCRSGRGLNLSRRLLLLEAAVQAGAAWLDLELELPASSCAPLIRLARERGCRLIVSHHDFEKTPGRKELEARRAACFRRGAQLAKIACRVRAAGDNARLLGLLADGGPTLVVGMGRLGWPTRLFAGFLGAPFVYASAGSGRETAPGQLSWRLVRRWQGWLEKVWEGKNARPA